ncbi:IS3 family transposase [Streptomyces sp. NPDC088353]|uniref:IS3 family transposase n=1 Tax=Streptomyces sp. NPDC088353 TaxID=3365855 RepID=UPI0038176AA6
MGIARSTFYYWLRTAPDRAARQARDTEMPARIRAVHAASEGTYGVLRITAELHDSGEAINHKKVARLMKASKIAGLRLRRTHRTTIADLTAAKAPDLVGRVFTADEPNQKYVGDVTCLPVGVGSSVTSRPSSTCAQAVWPAGRSEVSRLPAVRRGRGWWRGGRSRSNNGGRWWIGADPSDHYSAARQVSSSVGSP